MAHLNYEGLKRYNEKIKAYIEEKINKLNDIFVDKLDTKADKTEVFSGDYEDLINKPTIPDISNLASKDELTAHKSNKDIHVTSADKSKWNAKLDNTDLTNYATKIYVTDEIAKASTSGTVDLTGYAKTADLNAHTSDTNIHITSAEKTKWNEVDKKLSIKQSTADNGKILKVGNDGNIKFVEDLADDISYQNSNYPSWTNVKKALDGIMAKVDYIKPEITSFTSTAQSVYEVGQKISNIVFNWTTNKNVTTQTLTDCAINADSRTATYTNEINSNKTFTLTIGDGQNTASKNISISFRNKIYYGSASIPSSFDSAFILGLSNKQFATSKNGTYTVNVASNEYGFLAFPSSFGNISSVYIGGFDTEVVNCGTISFTNASGGTTNYNIYRTGRDGLGTIKMEIK